MLEASPSALRAFVLVASLRSFSKAAAALGTRQSTISSQIARLEEIVGQPLLERSTRRVALAPAGKRLLPLAEEIVELHTVAAARIHDASLTGAVRFGTTEGLWTSFPLAEALGRFGRSHPEVMLSVHLASAGETERTFRANGLDLCLTADPRDNTNGRLIRRERLRWFGRAPDAQHGMPLPLVETPYESALAAIQEALRQSEDGATRCTLAMRGADLANATHAILAGLGVGALPVGHAEAQGIAPYQGDLPALPSFDVYLLSNDHPGEAAVALRNQLFQRLGRASRPGIEPGGGAARQRSLAANRAR